MSNLSLFQYVVDNFVEIKIGIGLICEIEAFGVKNLKRKRIRLGVRNERKFETPFLRNCNLHFPFQTHSS